MSYKLGLLLSFFFMVQVLLFAGDLACIDAIHSELDAIAVTASYQISMNGELTEATKKLVHDEAGAEIYLLSEGSAKLGDSISFGVYRDYQPFIVSKEAVRISVRRTAIVGYFA
ncbi:MAG: hypothetical protein BWY98_00559 [Tenericutes bacterium ADurb.BinA155]|jgi:hypothetical protein|nr:MAG: hypothetical protein BWY98_00559 [Tenericutes bacterium ADurb.BinA155]